MFNKFKKIFTGDPQRKKLDRLVAIAEQINLLEPDFSGLKDEQLKSKTEEFRARLKDGETLDQILPEAFATVREASKRVLGQRHYDVQIICGINLHEGCISELRTGEGKTLSATLPLYLNALEGKGSHLVTVNDYLARRDGRWMGAIYHFLGLSVGILQGALSSAGDQRAFLYDPEERSLSEQTDMLRPVHRKLAYLADITYGTNSEFGFDYLRDNITMRWDQRVQRTHHFAIIDEVDNILIDEARTPLIISGPSHEDSDNYIRMAQIVKALNPEDFEVNEKDHTVTMTEIGIGHVEEMLGELLSDPERPEDVTPEQARQLGFLEQALRAQFLFRRNKEYIVQGGEVIIVDEFTGRMMPGRRWSDGLHQAVEAKEGVKVQAENITHATITIQNYFRMYKKLAGMTGTAVTEQEEFFRIYALDVLAIPTNLEYKAQQVDSGLDEIEIKDEDGYKYTYYYSSDDSEKTPLYYKRKDYPDVIYRTGEGKLRAIVMEILRYHVIGRPQLVGTTSVESSERLSERLAPDMVRRLIQVNLIRRAWLVAKGAKEEDYQTAPELAALNEPLGTLRMPELRRLGSQLGLSSLDPSDETNRESVLQILRLSTQDWQRVIPLFEGGIPHQVLNARKHTEESLIIAGAGAFGAVTIATNMAGRGVDIKLGGELTENQLAQVNQVLISQINTDPYNMTMPQRLEAIKSLDAALDESQQQAVDAFVAYMENMRKVRQLGGLHVIGSERHEARRIDNQLRGRAGRQGDPGSSRFYLALDDELMRMFGGGQMETLLTRFRIDENMPIEIGMINKLVEQAQTRVEGANFDVRKHLLEYDDVLNTQRNRIYSQRDRIFTKEDLHEDVTEMLNTEISARIKTGMEDTEGLWKLLGYLEDVQPVINTQYGNYPSFSLRMALNSLEGMSSENTLKTHLIKLAHEAVKAEDEHLERGVTQLLDRAEQSIKQQIAERIEILDTYLDNFDPTDQHDIQAELSNILQSSVRISAADQKSFRDDPRKMKKVLRDSLEVSTKLNNVRRILLTLEKRFNESWQLKSAEMAEKPWADIRTEILAQVKNTLERREERLFAENGEILRDLEANQEYLIHALRDEEEQLKLLQLTTRGTHIAFDAKSHRRQLRGHQRLTYVFSMAEQLSHQPVLNVTDQALTHLSGAELKLAEIIGKAEWNHLYNNGFTLSNMPELTKQALIEKMGHAGFDEISDLKLEQIPEGLSEDILEVLGNKAQNRIYRDLLLGTITETWVDYLTRMEALRVSISMESYAQRDPLVQYKSQASTLFTEMLSEVRQTVISRMFRYRPAQTGESADMLKNAAVIAETIQKAGSNLTSNSEKKKRRKRH